MTVINGSAGVPPEPDWALLFNDELDQTLAREAWKSIVANMRQAETFSPLNAHAIKRLIEFRIVYETASRHIAEEGPILKRARAKVGVWSPWWSVMRQADEAIRLLEAELGIPPTRRAKASKASRSGSRKWSAADEFLDGVKR
jgi:P27 family predicted phage terminase small subunit